MQYLKLIIQVRIPGVDLGQLPVNIPVDIPVDDDTLVVLIEQCLMLILIIGR